MAQVKLAEALLRRKELQSKVDQLHSCLSNRQSLFEVVAKRVKVTDSVDDFVANVPKLTASQVTAEYDYYASALRKIDAVIQQMNWTADVEVGNCMATYVHPK